MEDFNGAVALLQQPVAKCLEEIPDGLGDGLLRVHRIESSHHRDKELQPQVFLSLDAAVAQVREDLVTDSLARLDHRGIRIIEQTIQEMPESDGGPIRDGAAQSLSQAVDAAGEAVTSAWWRVFSGFKAAQRERLDQIPREPPVAVIP